MPWHVEDNNVKCQTLFSKKKKKKNRENAKVDY